MTRERVQVLGAGGHAKVLIATLRACGYEVVAVWDDAPARWGTECLAAPIRGAIADAEDLPTVLGIGDNRTRERLAGIALSWLSVIHPSAQVHESVALGVGTVVFAGAVIQPEAQVGTHVIVNTRASIDHDCRIGDFAHVGPGCVLCGDVSIGRGTLMGVGACARPGARVGAWSTVGAGAAVVSEIPDDALVGGVPARPLK